jgi:protocatechuate 3,4-dioxygenase alpha subunit
LASGNQGNGRCAEPSVAYVTLFNRGLVQHHFTMVFLEDDSAVRTLALLKQVPAARRATLIARKTAPGQYEWDVWMQTERETVFFDFA